MTATLAAPCPAETVEASVPEVAGGRLSVPLVGGGRVPYANLDHAASAPCLAEVRDAVDELLPWYASVHRGAGFASQVCTGLYERARAVLGDFVGARRGDGVVFTRNTTDALNLLARALPRGTSVVLFDTEHHAALLPWRGRWVRRIPTPRRCEEAAAALAGALRECPPGPRLVVLTGASNVTGELWPVRELAEVARVHGARIVLDVAQLAPHRRVDIRALDVDYVALSGHKLYAPFGAGALIGRLDWLRAAEPYLSGGGATRQVSGHGERLGVSWSAGPERHEAGSPNVVGAYALAVACQTIDRHGFAAVATHEQRLLHRLRAGLASVPGLRELSLFDEPRDRVGVVSFTVDGHEAAKVAGVLSAEHGIGVRDGAFCAHIATRRLLDRVGAAESRAVRASIGLGTTGEHVDRLIDALHTLVSAGPSWRYRVEDGRWLPDPDPRPVPQFLQTP